MKALCFTLLATLATLALSGHLSAKEPTTKIEVKGPGMATPIVITDADILQEFQVWAGPGTTSNEPQSLIIDWLKGSISEPSKELTRYDVSFYARVPESERLVYLVSYCYDPSAGEGYVYLPKSNVATIMHFNEGHWFFAWKRWDRVIRPLIEKFQTVPPHNPH